MIEVFENEQRVSGTTEFSHVYLSRHWHFTDDKGRYNMGDDVLLLPDSPPLERGYEWVPDSNWEVDLRYTTCDRDGWSYAKNYPMLVENRRNMTSIGDSSTNDYIRRRRWVRKARKASR